MRRLVLRAAVPILGLVLVLPAACGRDDTLPEGAIARVGTVFISQEQFESVRDAYVRAGKAPDKKQQPELFKRFERDVVQHLVVIEILRQEAPGYGIAVTDSEVQGEIDKIRQMFQGNEARFEAALERQGLTEADLERSVRERLLIDLMKTTITREVEVTEDAVRTYYEAHKADYTEGEVRKARHILVSPYVTPAGDEVILPSEVDWQTAKAEAEQIRSEILNGRDFGTAAAKYSDDEATADNGGELGEITRGQLVPEFEEAVFALRKGDLSEPVRTQYGYHLIQVTDIIPGRQLAYEEVKESIRSALLTSLKQKTWEDWLKERFATLGVSYRAGFEPVSATAGT